MKTLDEHKNVTLSLPGPLLRKFRIYAAARNESMTSVMAEAIQKLMDQDEHGQASKRRFIERIRNAPHRGTRGRVTWTRDELHER